MNKLKAFFKNYYGTILIFIAVFFAYKIATDMQYLDRYLYPQVGSIAESFQTCWGDMLQNLKASFGLLIPGMLSGVLVALAIGIPMGLSPRLRKTVYPIVYSVSMIPVVLLSPFAIHMAPTLRSASMFLVIWGTMWSMLFATINGIMTIDKRYLDNATTLELGGLKRLVRIVLPAALPSMAGGFVSSVRSAFLSLIFAEMYGTKLGLGYFVKANADLGRFENVWSGFLFMAFVMVIVMQLVEVVKNRMLHWTID